MATPSCDIKTKLSKVVADYPQAKGLAIMVANEFSTQSRQQLKGTVKDLTRIQQTFTKLKFSTIAMRNVSDKEILDAINAVAGFHFPKSYRRIAFTFSGHGDNGCVHTHTGPLSVDDIVNPLQPGNSPQLAQIPKLFFIDACRGRYHERVTLVSRGPDADTTTEHSLVPSRGNILLAYSTMPQCKAFEVLDEGGVWMKVLSEKLCTVQKSILDVVTDVNTELLKMYQDRRYRKCMQQPILESTLHEIVNLVEEAGMEPNC